ncbi:hypothetical protein [Maricaulis sp. CAU 1757]
MTKRNPKTRGGLLAVLAPSLLLGACATTHYPPVAHGPYVPPPPLDTVSPAVRMCAVDTLAEQRLAMLDEAHRYRVALGAHPDPYSRVADTETQELIAAFETDLDASYRFATSSCRTWNRCLEENRFNEAACRDSAAMWRDGQDRFHALSGDLAVIRERIALVCDDCAGPAHGYARPHYGPGHRYYDTDYRHRRDSHGHRRARNEDDLLGSVFSTDEGHDSSYHDGHH